MTLIDAWEQPLVPGTLLQRYERFIAEVRLRTGEVVRAHCVNPGRMEGLVIPGAVVWLSKAPVARALPYTWELIELNGLLVGTNTNLANALVRTVLERRLISGLGDVHEVRPEQALGRGHRVDFKLTTRRGLHWVEVKNCHLVYPDRRGYFPDSHSERAVKHVEALSRRVAKGDRATVVFTLQRSDVDGLRPSALHAPDFARAVWTAARKGVVFRALRFEPTLEGVRFLDEVPVDTQPYDEGPLMEWSRLLDSTSGWLRKDGRMAGSQLRR